jgi:hypothetical protein
MKSFVMKSFVIETLNAINKNTCCPPAKLPEKNNIESIIVASMMRSGTHLLIDLIINNFKAYKNTPLYLNLDEAFLANYEPNDIENSGGIIMKTHYPQAIFTPENIEKLESIITNKKILIPVRSIQQIEKSYKRFTNQKSGKLLSLSQDQVHFSEYWNKYPNVKLIEFDRLVNPVKTAALVKELADFLGIKTNRKLICSLNKKNRVRILFRKLLTRVLGSKSPLICTGIRLSKATDKMMAFGMIASFI